MHTTPQNPVKSDHLYVKYCSWIIDRQPDKSNEHRQRDTVFRVSFIPLRMKIHLLQFYPNAPSSIIKSSAGTWVKKRLAQPYHLFKNQPSLYVTWKMDNYVTHYISFLKEVMTLMGPYN